jgi:hypothetical protein
MLPDVPHRNNTFCMPDFICQYLVGICRITCHFLMMFLYTFLFLFAVNLLISYNYGVNRKLDREHCRFVYFTH